MRRPILVVTSRFIKPVDARIEKEYEVRRKADGTLFTRDELLATYEGADAILITPFDRLDADFFRKVSSVRINGEQIQASSDIDSIWIEDQLIRDDNKAVEENAQAKKHSSHGS